MNASQRIRRARLPHPKCYVSASHGHFDSPLKFASSNHGQYQSFGDSRLIKRCVSSAAKSNNLKKLLVHVDMELDKKPMTYIELPAPMRGWPTPLVTQADVDSYFPVLYEHSWFVEYLSEDGNALNKEGGEDMVRTRSAALAKRFGLVPWVTEDDLREIIEEIEECENSNYHFLCEQHHVEKRPSHPEPNVYTIISQTHSAVLPSPPDAASSNTKAEQGDVGANNGTGDRGKKKPKGMRMPGITLRDIRFALLLEKGLRAKELGVRPVEDPSQKRPLNVQENISSCNPPSMSAEVAIALGVAGRVFANVACAENIRLGAALVGVFDGFLIHRSWITNTLSDPLTLVVLAVGLVFDHFQFRGFEGTITLLLGCGLGVVLADFGPDVWYEIGGEQLAKDVSRELESLFGFVGDDSASDSDDRSDVGSVV
ncbi:hypothetical protein EW145_g6779, partial [Phellinidium pouzarii]